jgi:hypothetical protein
MFLQFYTIWLFFLAIPGTAVAIGQLFTILEHNDITPNILTAQSIIYSILLSIWSTIFIERWKRKTSEIKMVCSIDDDHLSALKIHRSVRNDFHGNEGVDDVTGYVEKHLSTSSRICILLLELLVLSVILGCAGFIFYLLQAWKVSMRDHEHSTIYSMIGGTINGITIIFLNYIYGYCARFFAKLENHKLETTYQQWMTAKIFIFQLINGNIALFWAGFVEQDSLKLYSLLFTIMITKQVVNTVKQLIVPTIKVCCNRQRHIHESTVEEDKEFIENAFVRLKYDGIMDDYGEMIQQFSYLINFSAAFPFAPLISFVLNIIQNYGEFNLYLNQIQRPLSNNSSGVGKAWIVVMETLGLLAVVINFYLLYSTLENYLLNDQINKWAHFLSGWKGFGWNILVIEHVIIGAKILLSVFIKDKPSWVVKEEKRKALARERKIRQQIQINEEKTGEEYYIPAPPSGRPKNVSSPSRNMAESRKRRGSGGRNYSNNRRY